MRLFLALFFPLLSPSAALTMCDSSAVPADNARILSNSWNIGTWFRPCEFECFDDLVPHPHSAVCCPQLPPEATWSTSPESSPCSFDCGGNRVVHGQACCPMKPASSFWLEASGPSCAFSCDPDHVRRGKKCCPAKPARALWVGSRDCSWTCPPPLEARGEVCCAGKPQGAVWSNAASQGESSGCAWTCPEDKALLDGRCVDAIVAEVVNDAEARIKKAAADALVEFLVSEGLSEGQSKARSDSAKARATKKKRVLFDSLFEHLREEEAASTKGPQGGIDTDTLIERFVEDDLTRQRVEAREEADAADAGVAELDSFLEDAGALDEEEGLRASELSAEASRRAAALVGDVEFLSATIRFQNQRLQKRREALRKAQGAGKSEQQATVERLERELEAAKTEATSLQARAEEAARKLELSKAKTQKALRRQADYTLSVENEKVEVLVTPRGRRSKGNWRLVPKAILDTGNASMCTMSWAAVRALGLETAAKTSMRTKEILGVLVGKTEHWPVIEIEVRIKGHTFPVEAAVGGSTSILVSQPDVIAKLMRKGYAIGAS